MTADQALVTFRFGDAPIVVKMPKDFEIAADQIAGIEFDTALS